MRGWSVAVCVLAAVLLATGEGPVGARSPARRLSAWADGAGAGRNGAGRTGAGAGGRGSRRLSGWLARWSRRGKDGDAGGVVTAVTELSVLLRSGLAPSRAWALLPRGGDPVLDRALDAAADAEARGEDVAAALRSATGAARPSATSRALDGLAATWLVARRTGAPIADVLLRYAEALRAEVDARDAREAALAAPRATAKVLVGLPPAGLALGLLVGADPFTVLVATTPGRVCAVVGTVCAALGWWWTRRLLASASRPDP